MQHPKYHLQIKPRRSLFDINLKELWDYRNLIVLFVRRDFASLYKQTILGPLWFFIQPLVSTRMFTIVFAKNILGYKPAHNLENGLKQAVECLLSLWLLSTRGEHSW